MTKEGIKEILDANLELREKLFARGFLFTNRDVNYSDYPFYGLWACSDIGKYHLLVSPEQKFYKSETPEKIMFLIGHCYNPVRMMADEEEILKCLILSKKEDFFNQLNELTGIFTLIIIKRNGNILLLGDASGMQTTFYTENGVCISSHTNLIGDLFGFNKDPYVEKLSHYRFFKLLGNALPGNLTQFKEVERLIPNHYVSIPFNGKAEVKRFFWPSKLPKTEEEIVDEVSNLMAANMQLISEKWRRPAISLTGGCDSKTTLACTKCLYDRFSYFSYVSSDSEKVDAEAAKEICKALDLPHTTYTIPIEDDGKTKAVSEILNWNTGNIRYSHPNDVRKRAFFSENNNFDIEVKSWASEIGRAYYSKRFHGRKDFGKITPRKCTTLYKFFFNNRNLVRETDKVFQEYINKYFRQAKENPIEWQEQFFWEFRVPSWNGLVITGEHRYSFDITIPYNNRLILSLLLSTAIEKRISDDVYRKIRSKMNPKIDATGISVTNLKHTENREKAENIYYMVHSKVPF